MALVTNPGTTQLDLDLDITGDVVIDWGDTTTTTLVGSGRHQVSHIYAVAGEYEFDFDRRDRIAGMFPAGSDSWGGIFEAGFTSLVTTVDILGNNTISDVSALTSATFVVIWGNNTISDVSALTSATTVNIRGNNTISDVSALTSATTVDIRSASTTLVDSGIKLAWSRRDGANQSYRFNNGSAQPPTDTMDALRVALMAGDLGSASLTIDVVGPPVETDENKTYQQIVSEPPLAGFYPTGDAASDAAIESASATLAAGRVGLLLLRRRRTAIGALR